MKISGKSVILRVMKMNSRYFYTLFAAMMLIQVFSFQVSARERKLYVVTTGDVHGSWFDRAYVEGQGLRTSLMSVKAYVDSLREAVGKENVLLLDAGDCLQGDNAAYYYNYVDTSVPHLFPRVMAYMGYDAVIVGNHDIETGHDVYDRVNAELEASGIPWLGGNAVRNDNGEPYFPVYNIFDKAGMKVAVLGFNNANISAWLSESLWEGMSFKSLIPLVQQWVDRVNSEFKPDVTVAVVHSGTGEGNGQVLENQGLDLLYSLKGVDLLVTAHDHSPYTTVYEGCGFLNGGARAGNVGYAEITAQKRGRKLLSKEVKTRIVRMDKRKVDKEMQRVFDPEYQAVKAFTNKKVGSLAMDMKTRDAYAGMSDYINLVHRVQLSAPEAQISFAAPLTFNGTVKAGELVFNDMFTIYPYENQMFVVRLKGDEIKNYLEYSYDGWIQTPGEHVLKIKSSPDARTGAERWSFVGRSYNFDSAAGLVYTVDVTKPAGERVNIISLADGTAFDGETWYNVAMTSYRANGGGDLLPMGAGVPDVEADNRVVARYPEIRNMIYDYILKVGELNRANTGDKKILGEWHFIPEEIAEPLIEADMDLIF